MPHEPLLLAIDQGTTSTRVFLFDTSGNVLESQSARHQQYHPKPGWVEHNAEEIWTNTLSLLNAVVLREPNYLKRIISCGITNQRETIVAWNKQTGEVLAPAIVWQDNRTESYCEGLIEAGHEKSIREKTGLLLSPYFSASKIAWLIEHVPSVKASFTKDELACGTIDAFLVYKLTKGKSFKTDVTNASRTLLFNIDTLAWDETLLNIFHVPQSILPQAVDCDSHFGDIVHFDKSIPITGVVGDQQAAAIGQGCFLQGDTKMTFGTGGFLLVNTGDINQLAPNKLISTIAYRLQNNTSYAMEGSIFHAASIINWLKEIGVIERPEDCDKLASLENNFNELVLVPSFTGLGAPYWRADLKAALLGLTLDCKKPEIVAAALRSIVFQTLDLIEALDAGGIKLNMLRVDGGVSRSDWLVQKLSDVSGLQVTRPRQLETTVLGAMMVAGLGAHHFKKTSELTHLWKAEKTFFPQDLGELGVRHRKHWKRAIQKLLRDDLH